MLAQVSHSMSAVWVGVLAVLAQVSHSMSAVWVEVSRRVGTSES